MILAPHAHYPDDMEQLAIRDHLHHRGIHLHYEEAQAYDLGEPVQHFTLPDLCWRVPLPQSAACLESTALIPAVNGSIRSNEEKTADV